MARLVLSAVARFLDTSAAQSGDAFYAVLISVVDMDGAPVVGLPAGSFTFAVQPVTGIPVPMTMLEIHYMAEETLRDFEGVYNFLVKATLGGAVEGPLWPRLAINVLHNTLRVVGDLENPLESLAVNRGRILIPVAADIGDEAGAYEV